MQNLIEAPLALLAGVLTVASPCVLPVLPIILGTSAGQTSRTRPLFISLGFVLTFAAFGMLLSVVSRVAGIAQDTLRNAGIALCAVAWLTRIWPAPYDWLMRHIGGPLHRVGGAGAAAKATNGGAFDGQFASTKVRVIAGHAGRLQKVFGVLILLSAAAMFYHYDVLAYAWLADSFPTLKGM